MEGETYFESKKQKITVYHSVKITWNKIENGQGYEIYRAESKTGIKTLIATIDDAATTTYSDTGLTCGKTYYYTVKAYTSYVDSAGATKIVYGKESTATVKPILNTPKSISVKAGKKKAVIKWSKVSGASGYDIQRSAKKTSGYKSVKTVSSKVLTWTNTKLKKGKTYYFKIRAYKTVGGKKVYGGFTTYKAVKVK